MFMFLILPFSLSAETIDMSITVQPTPSLTFNGDMIYPLRTEVYQLGASGGSSDFTNTDGSFLTVTFPSGVLFTFIDLYISSYNKDFILAYYPLPTGLDIVGSVIYDITAFDGLTEKNTFGSNFSIRFHYTDEQIAGFNEETFKIHFWNASQGEWKEVSDFVLDQLNNNLTISLNHLTLFALFGELKGSTAAIGEITAQLGSGGPIFFTVKNGDFNRDGKVDVLDFNILMVNWGKTIPSNLASVIDINRDSRIGIEDFNLLMVNWSR